MFINDLMLVVHGKCLNARNFGENILNSNIGGKWM